MMDTRKSTDVEKIAEAIKKLPKPQLQHNRKLLVKNKILSQIEEPTASYVHGFAEKIGLDAVTRARIRERVFALIEGRRQKVFFWGRRLRFATSLFVLFLMVFGMFSFISVDTTVVMAETFTTLDSFSGEVFVQRDGEFLEIQEGMGIYEKDRVITGGDGLASIKFFDDSVSRLAEESELIVNKLFRAAESSVKTYVEISLVDGLVWSRVVNLVGEHSSFVVEAKDVYATAQKAAFNVEIKNEEVEIKVFNNVLDVRTPEKTDKVISGKKAVLDKEKQVEVKEIGESEREDIWVKENLDNDKFHLTEVEQRLLAAKMESAGIEVGEDLKLGNSIKEDAMLFLTFDDVKKKKKQLDLSERGFIAAQVQLDKSDLSDKEEKEAQEALAVFSEKVEDFYILVDEVERADTDYAAELRVYVGEKVLVQKKNLSLTLPDNLSYEAKEVIEELELLGADETLEVVELKMEQASTKLAEAEDMIFLGDYELAEEVIEEYKKDMEDVVEMIDSIDEDGGELKEEVLAKVGGKVVEDFELLDNIGVISDVELAEIATELQEIGVEVPSLDVVENIQEEVEQEEEKYGIKIEGDKPLPPFLSF